MIIHKKKKAVLLRLRNPTKVTTVIPTAVQTPGGYVAVPHRPDETRVLRNLGFTVPDPMPLHYEWPKAGGRHDPFEAQRETASFLSMNDRAFCLNSFGTGKTLAALWTYDYLHTLKRVKRVLVICPLSTMERTWADSVFNTFPHLQAVVLYGTRERRLKLLKEDADIYIINIDGARSIESAMAKRPDIDLIIVDELAMVRNGQTERFKTLNRICNLQGMRKVWGMTGSPTPNSPTDAWAQCRLVNPTNPDNPRYFGRFKDMVLRQVAPFKWMPRDEANDIVFKTLQPSIRFSLEDCVDLPEQTVVVRDAPLTPEQTKAYKEMFAKLATEASGGQILAVNEAIKTGKLLQICAGVAYGTGGEPIALPAGPRIEVLREIIEESEGKVIVFVPLTGALEELYKHIKDFGVEIVHGDTPKNERDRIFHEFQTQDAPRVLLANAQTMSHGLTLTAATTIVWYAPVHSNEVYSQACARVRRPGQTRKTVIVHIAGTDVERKVYKRLHEKESLQGILLDMVKESRGQEIV